MGARTRIAGEGAGRSCPCALRHAVATALLSGDPDVGIREALARLGPAVGARRLRFLPAGNDAGRGYHWELASAREDSAHSGRLPAAEFSSEFPVFLRGRPAGTLAADVPVRGETEALFLREAAELIALSALRGRREPDFGLSPRILRLGMGPRFEISPEGAVILIRADADYSQVRLTGGREVMDARGLTAWEPALAGTTFRRVHRRFIANLGHFRGVDRTGGSWRLTLSDGSVVPVGRSYRARFGAEFGF